MPSSGGASTTVCADDVTHMFDIKLDANNAPRQAVSAAEWARSVSAALTDITELSADGIQSITRVDDAGGTRDLKLLLFIN